MMKTETEMRGETATRVIDSVDEAERSALEAVRKFVDTVNGVFPDVSSEAGPRQKVIDSAFKMTEQLVGASNLLAHGIVHAAEDALREADKTGPAAKK